MSTKINLFKKATCFMAILALILTSLSTTALASSSTKTVTYERAYTFQITPSNFPTYYDSPSSYVNPTYNYNDGKYKGTLNLSYAYCCVPEGMEGIYLRVRIQAVYSGTVTAYDAGKIVTRDFTTVISVQPHLVQFYLSNPSINVPPAFNYDDGTYKGVLKLAYSYCGSPYVVGHMVNIPIYAKYSGTVYLK